MKTRLVAIGLISAFSAAFFVGRAPVQTYTFDEPIDALSIGVQEDIIELSVSAKTNDGWTQWFALEIEKEFDPELRESSLVIFPESTTTVRVRGTQENYELHPITASQEPVSYQVAGILPPDRPRILSRKQWKADDKLLVNGRRTTRSDIRIGEETVTVDTSGGSARARKCERDQRHYADDFKVIRTVRHDGQGRELRWPQRYSPSVKRLVVHHTAQNVTADKRSGVERMRMLYQYHAKSRGWGDVGYHFIVDENGKIYEGRAGGKYVVGGHAYCANVGTIGVALMGNFDKEKPTQKQMQALQWLLSKLADDYRLDLKKDTAFRGKGLPAIVGHKDVVSTSCPGYYVRETLHQVRRNVRRGLLGNTIRFPKEGPKDEPRTANIAWFKRALGITLTPVGQPNLTGKPGEQMRVSMLLRAGDKRVNRRERISEVIRSDSRIGVWEEVEGRDMRIRKELLAPRALQSKETTSVRLRIQFPPEEGTYTLRFGDTVYILTAKGRPVQSNETKVRGRKVFGPAAEDSTSLLRSAIRRNRPSKRSLTPAAKRPAMPASDRIRIRLSYEGNSAALSVGRNTKVNESTSNKFRIDLRQNSDECVATEFGRELGRGVVRIHSGNGESTVTSWQTHTNRFRGILECRVVDGELVLINELPLEQYLLGLAEEPDSEPYEKQKAFAVAARSYAGYYMSPDNRKFPGKPYDGDDSPMRFQKYGGLVFEERNPQWQKAVRETDGLVIKKNGQTVKTPYYSSNDGQSKSPKEAGWLRYPFAEVFSSKPDPWCKGMVPRGHGVGMSGCGARGQALDGESYQEILEYYYPGTELKKF